MAGLSLRGPLGYTRSGQRKLQERLGREIRFTTDGDGNRVVVSLGWKSLENRDRVTPRLWSSVGYRTYRDIVECPVWNRSSVRDVVGVPLERLGKSQDQNPQGCSEVRLTVSRRRIHIERSTLSTYTSDDRQTIMTKMGSTRKTHE